MKLLLLIGLWGMLVEGREDKEQPRNGMARLIIYRQREFGGNDYNIKLNDTKLGTLSTNRFFLLDVPPGRVKIESVKDYFSENQRLWLNLQAGQTYYVKAVEDIDFFTRTLLMAPIGQEQAERELRKIKPAKPLVPSQNP